MWGGRKGREENGKGERGGREGGGGGGGRIKMELN